MRVYGDVVLTGEIADRMMRRIVRMYGWQAALRFCAGIGISLEDCYYMVFGKEVRK